MSNGNGVHTIAPPYAAWGVTLTEAMGRARLDRRALGNLTRSAPKAVRAWENGEALPNPQQYKYLCASIPAMAYLKPPWPVIAVGRFAGMKQKEEPVKETPPLPEVPVTVTVEVVKEEVPAPRPRSAGPTPEAKEKSRQRTIANSARPGDSFGARLSRARAGAGLTREEAATLLGNGWIASRLYSIEALGGKVHDDWRAQLVAAFPELAEKPVVAAPAPAPAAAPGAPDEIEAAATAYAEAVAGLRKAQEVVRVAKERLKAAAR